MPFRVNSLAVILALFVLSFTAQGYEAPTVPAPRPLRYPADTFAFKNETVWNYVGGSIQPEADRAHVREYTRRCFVLSRAIVQFWKFARFEPAAAAVPAD